MRIKVLFDNENSSKDLCAGWGISLLLEDKILFDTGERGSWLIRNLKELNVDLRRLEAIVISHDHADHTGGLWEVLKKRSGIQVYACPKFSTGFKEKAKGLNGRLVEAGKMTDITTNVFTTGEISGEYKGAYMPEQSLVLKTENGVSVLTGCAHPGVVNIIREVRKRFPQENIYAVIGGFHLMTENEKVIELIIGEFKKMGVRKVGPMHCTGYEAKEKFREAYGKNFFVLKAGGEIHI